MTRSVPTAGGFRRTRSRCAAAPPIRRTATPGTALPTGRLRAGRRTAHR
ncbi:hypothetical protein [Micromonospora sp. KC721]|nr:hypothetical protein [Micromonospora sp. KC721]